MRLARAILVALLPWFIGDAAAQSVVNLQPVRPPVTQQPTQQRGVAASMAPSTPLGQLPPSLSDSALSQLEPQPGESNTAFLARMKSVSQKAVSEMERTLREHNAKMQALAPK